METAINNYINLDATETVKHHTWANILAAIDRQAENKTAWYVFSLLFQGVLFLPIPAVLMYYYHSSIIVLPITFGFYLANIIAGMGGSGIRFVIGLFILTALVNLGMLAMYIL